MIIPIRCMGCGKPTAHLYEKYNEELKKGKSPKEVLDKIGMERYCCRSLFISHIDLLETVAKFKKG
ncbi:MAG: DNA-directed RNA polymerase subunit N [Nanoarchaeota archaeon]